MQISNELHSYNFDDRNITWHKLGDFKYFVFAMLDVDVEKKIVDAILKFEPNEQIFLHRHLAQTNTLVVQGEHRIYEPDGTLQEVRKVGSYTCRAASQNPHREGGGADGAIVFYSIRTEQDAIFEILDRDNNAVETLGLQDFSMIYQQQKQTGI